VQIVKAIKEKMKIIVIFHHDVDGLTCASLLLLALGFGNIWIFVSQDPNEEFPVLQADIVIIVDIAVTEKTWGSLKNIQAKQIVWIDHHKPFTVLSSLNVPENVQLILDPSSPSAVLLVKKYFGLDDEISRKITELGTKADTWQLDVQVQEWMDLDSAFSFYKKDKAPLILRLAEGKFEISGELQDVLTKYREEKEKAKEILLNNVRVKNIHGHSVAIGYAVDPLSGSEGADKILKATNSEVQIVIKPQGWMSFRRRKDSKINLIELAKIFGGGGHEYASGAELGKSVTLENFQEIAEEIFSKISSVL